MTYNRTRYHRRSIRLKGYDYGRPGAYFVTVCTHRRACLFGEVVNGEMRLNPFGEIVHREWFRTTGLRANIELREDEMVVMPNHVHGVIRIVGDRDPVGATRRVAPTGASGPAAGSVGAIIGQFKSVVAKQINTLRNTPGVPVWQRNYYEHVIRDDESLTRIRQYIVENPARWAVDRDNPAAVNPEPEEG